MQPIATVLDFGQRGRHLLLLSLGLRVRFGYPVVLFYLNSLCEAVYYHTMDVRVAIHHPP